MRRIITLNIYLILFCLLASAQSNSEKNKLAKFYPKDTIDVSVAECIYQYIVTDSILDKFEDHYLILQMGKEISKQQDYFKYIKDSTYLEIGLDKVTWGVADSLAYKYADSTPWQIFKDKKTNGIEVHDRIFIDYFVYHDDNLNFDWQLLDDTLNICGYQCQRASTCFRGRQWTAWYCDLPVSDGPWEFGGLPGLILQMEDKSRHHVFKAISIRKGGNMITKTRNLDEFKTTKERFRKLLDSYKEDPLGLISSGNEMPFTVTDQFGNPAEPPGRMFYNNIEME